MCITALAWALGSLAAIAAAAIGTQLMVGVAGAGVAEGRERSCGRAAAKLVDFATKRGLNANDLFFEFVPPTEPKRRKRPEQLPDPITLERS